MDQTLKHQGNTISIAQARVPDHLGTTSAPPRLNLGQTERNP
jgi:hypothetical protein